MDDKNKLSEKFIFTEKNFQNPKLPSGLEILDIPLVEATEQNLEGKKWF